MASSMHLFCTVCEAVTNSIEELHSHQTHNHTRAQLSWSVLTLQGLINSETAIGEKKLQPEYTWVNANSKCSQNCQNWCYPNENFTIADHGRQPVVSQGTQFARSVAAQLKQVSWSQYQQESSKCTEHHYIQEQHNVTERRYQCQKHRFTPGHMSMQFKQPSELEVKSSPLSDISDEIFQKSVNGICKDLKTKSTVTKKQQRAKNKSKLTSFEGKKISENTRFTTNISKESHGKRDYKTNKTNTANSHTAHARKTSSQAIVMGQDVVQSSSKVNLEFDRLPKKACTPKQLCLQYDTKQEHRKNQHGRRISCENQMTHHTDNLDKPVNVTCKKSEATWPKYSGDARSDNYACNTRIESNLKYELPVQSASREHIFLTTPNTPNNIAQQAANERICTFLSFLNPWNDFVTVNDNLESSEQNNSILNNFGVF